MSRDLLDLLTPRADDGVGRIYGVVTAVVTNNQDPDKRGRVRVRFPWLAQEGEGESWWARVAVPMAGDGMGTYFLPEVDDEVLVAFLQGDPRFPYVLGALWGANRQPPEEVDEKNTKRTIKSRSGHVIRLDDTDGEEKIEIIDAKEKVTVVIDSKESTITVSADKDVTIESANGKLTLKGTKGVDIESGDTLTITSSGEAKLQSDAKLTVKGSSVEIN
jgi:uncharacterized protein involved in type VI secretion and phage assembly